MKTHRLVSEGTATSTRDASFSSPVVFSRVNNHEVTVCSKNVFDVLVD